VTAPALGGQHLASFRPLRSLATQRLVAHTLGLGQHVLQVQIVVTTARDAMHLHVEVLRLPN
jgi:hypothetical protein